MATAANGNLNVDVEQNKRIIKLDAGECTDAADALRTYVQVFNRKLRAETDVVIQDRLKLRIGHLQALIAKFG